MIAEPLSETQVEPMALVTPPRKAKEKAMGRGKLATRSRPMLREKAVRNEMPSTSTAIPEPTLSVEVATDSPPDVGSPGSSCSGNTSTGEKRKPKVIVLCILNVYVFYVDIC